MKNKLKQAVIGTAVALGVFISQLTACYAADNATELQVTAKAAIVMDAQTGRVIYAKDAESKRYPASTTKMMTLIVALEKGNLKDMVTVSKQASETEGSTMWLENGETMELRDLLYGIMLVSGNDATVAVAEHIAGSVSAYAELMTQKAHDIGALDTNFANSSGLPDPNHYTTAHDLARIAAYGYKNPMFAEIVSTKEKIVPWAVRDYGRDLNNENRMLWLYEGANGVKTGYTNAAGRCLVSAAKRDGVQLISVVLDSEFMWNDSIALLNYGFQNIKTHRFYKKGDIIKTVNVRSGKHSSMDLKVEQEVKLPVVDNELSKFRTVIDIPDDIEAPVKRGQRVGKLRIYYDNSEVTAIDIKASEDVAQKSFFMSVYQTLRDFMRFIGIKL